MNNCSELGITGLIDCGNYDFSEYLMDDSVMEDKLGSIEVGKYADMIVLDSNLFETDVYKIHDVNVVETIMDGVTRFKK